ncbi:PmoA family protein [Halalkalibaculum sp. DA3122]|uniref:DUF6807 domain-containing protein n=1 Tax=Halalkalibaculum sp. DA3122 TaxID=3373607 RepID=UPI003753F669
MAQHIVLLLVGLFWATGAGQAMAQYEITVSAGAFDRVETVASFTFPEPVAPGTYRMNSDSGENLLLQVDENQRGSFILRELPSEETRTYTVDTEAPVSSMPGQPEMSISAGQRTLIFNDGSRKVLSYYHRENRLPPGMDKMYKRAGYIHPLYSPGGVPLTNHLDQEIHPHHYGIFSAWTNTEFQGRTPDFWNPHNHSGRVDHADSVEKAWEGPVHAGFKAKNYFVDISGSAPVTALNEEWKVIVYNTASDGDYNMVDLVLTHTTNTGQPLVLPEYHYGGLAFRGHGDWNNPENVSFVTSEGMNRDEANETRARWVHMGGLVNGERAGVALLGHPDNYRAPQPIRIHPETPYVVYAPMQLGKMTIEPGSPYIMRYRFVTYDGEPDIEKINRLWNDYAYPPGITVEKQ